MTEFVGLGYYAEIPVVIWDIQRIGPSTGLPTRTSQADLRFATNMGHGDSDTIVLMPGNMNECFDFGWQSFDVAERLQTPVVVLSDLDMGMNQWMSKPFEYPKIPMDRGKVLLEKDLEELKGNWGRYLDKDSDGIPYRTFPGNKHPMSSYFTRGTGHDEYAKYTEDAAVFHRNMLRLQSKFVTAKQYLPKPVVFNASGAKTAIIAYGSTESAIIEARDILVRDHGINTDFMRVRSYPFTHEVDEFIEKYDQIFVIEMNRDGQLHQLLSLAYPGQVLKFKSIAFGDGMPASAKWMLDGILAQYDESPTKSSKSSKVKRAASKVLPKKSGKKITANGSKKGAK
jgi:2-oxoglutarate ferredoxin oxidoreductase subunit alpha